MFEKVNPSHPDKIADRIAGAMVDLAYKKCTNPKVAIEVLIGHNYCHIIAETSVRFRLKEIKAIVYRIAGKMKIDFKQYAQDAQLAANQSYQITCGDNGIFKGMPITIEQTMLTMYAQNLYSLYNSDGKYIYNSKKNLLVICQSNAKESSIKELFPKAIINPLGYWTGGTNVDTGATNRKLGSDMGNSITGGGLHGKDLSKADVSINIYAFIKAQQTNKKVELACAIGDTLVDGKPYYEIVRIAKEYIDSIGGFEKLAEWGLIR